jgi:NADPH:quinone reductase-like Zn-dependent oxidoreductase
MKAAIRRIYGSPDILKIETVEKPTIKDNEVLIRVYATTVNRTDCAVLTGKPLIMRLFTGLITPKLPTPGTDFAGKIEAVGKEVKSFQVNDKVWGFDDQGLGSQAEYMRFSAEGTITKMPDNIAYEQAAASLEAAHYAYNFINKVKLQAGQKILINGATGAIGSALLQFLKYYNIYVTAVCNTQNKDLIKSLGADKIIDYNKEDFTNDDEKYDFIFDAVGKSTFAKCKPLLKKNGIYISSELGPKAQNPLLALITPFFGGKKVIFPIPSNIKRSMSFIGELIEKGKFKAVIDKKYPLENISEAYHYVASGKKTGNVIITMPDNYHHPA